MKAIVTVVGKDQVGIIAGVCNTLAEYNVNVLDISQTIMEGYFTMMMVVDLAACGRVVCVPERGPAHLRRGQRPVDTHPARGYIRRDAQAEVPRCSV